MIPKVTIQNPGASPSLEGRARLAHAEDPGEGADPGQDDGDPGQPLHDQRQVVVDRREVDVEGRRDELPERVVLVGEVDGVVVDVPEVDDVLGVDERERPVRQLVEDLALRRADVAQLHELALEGEELLQGVVVRPAGRSGSSRSSTASSIRSKTG